MCEVCNTRHRTLPYQILSRMLLIFNLLPASLPEQCNIICPCELVYMLIVKMIPHFLLCFLSLQQAGHSVQQDGEPG